MRRLDGKVAIITGATGGIGLAAARLFAQEGARLVLVDLRDGALRDAAAQIGPESGTAIETAVLDVSADDSAQRYTDLALRRFGQVDVALLNAGIEGEIGPIGTTTLAGYDRVMAVNVRSVWLGLSALMPVMKASGRGGSIVVTSSTGGLRGTPFLAPYGASKHAVIGLAKSAAVEGARDGIRVNAVNPGPTDTRMIDAITAGRSPGGLQAGRTALASRIPAGRLGRPEEIAALMLFLAGDESQFCNGGTYAVDGAMVAG